MIKKFLRSSFRRNSLTFFLKFAMGSLVLAIAVEMLSQEGVKLKFNEQNLENQEIYHENLTKNEKIEFLDRQSGKVTLNGWATNLDKRVILNHEDGLIKGLGKRLNQLNFRAWDFFVFYTGETVITIPFVNFGIICSTSVNIFNRSESDFVGSRLRQEVLLLKCPEMDLHSVGVSRDSLDYNGLYVEVEQGEGGIVTIEIEAPALDFKAYFTFNDSFADGQFWAVPLSPSQQLYFIDNKKFGLPVTGQYSLNGETYYCDLDEECLALYDLGRGQFNYFTNWYWASFTSYIDVENQESGQNDAVVFSLNLGDGLGVNFENKRKASEDFININGTHFKLDQTYLAYDSSNLTAPHSFSTITQDKKFPDRHCQIEFVPSGIAYDGLYAVILGFQQYLVFGKYSGQCQVDGKVYRFQDVLGTVEHVRAKF